MEKVIVSGCIWKFSSLSPGQFVVEGTKDLRNLLGEWSAFTGFPV